MALSWQLFKASFYAVSGSFTALIISAIYEDCRVTSMIKKLQNMWKRVDHTVQKIMAMAMNYMAPLVKRHNCYDMLMLKQKKIDEWYIDLPTGEVPITYVYLMV